MNYLSFDYGDKRIGYAIADLKARIALPSGVLGNDSGLRVKIQDLVSSKNVYKIVVGFPLNLRRNFTPATEKAVAFADSVHRWTGIQVLLVDERMTTSLSYAYSQMIGLKSKESKKNIDANSAKEILESYLNNPGQCIEFVKNGVDLNSTVDFLKKVEAGNMDDLIKINIDGGKYIFDCVDKSLKNWIIYESNPYYYLKLSKKKIPENVSSYEFAFSKIDGIQSCARGSNG